MNLARLAAILTAAAWLSGFSFACHAGAYDDLVAAVENGDNATVVDLLRRGMEADSVDREGNSLLILAARAGQQQIVETLLTNKANVLITNKYHDSALMLAALRGHLSAVETLVAAGAKLDPGGWTPLIYAAFEGHEEIARFLLEQGADKDAIAPNGMTALMAAARNGHQATVELLVEKGADPGKKLPNGETAVDLAAKAGNKSISARLRRVAGAQP